MHLRRHKTKIVATIGPASSSGEILKRMIEAGLSVARLNFSHGTFDEHRETIRQIRNAEAATGSRVTIMADLPGPKMRLGEIDPGPINLSSGDRFILTTEETTGDAERVSTSFDKLPQVVKSGDRLFLNDGLVQLVVEEVQEQDVHCRVAAGGELNSRKGLNLPGIDLGIGAFTEWDRECLAFALGEGVDAVSQSFVESADDLKAVRTAANELGKEDLFLIAKIERYSALDRMEEILKVTDGIMVARGDLGVEAPIEEIAILQKELIARANRMGVPVITATQMLESMTSSRLPTRAEATDVANAILDGTDCVMLSAESAVGKYPVESVRMLADIAAFTEKQKMRRSADWGRKLPAYEQSEFDELAMFAEHALDSAPYDALVAPSRTGRTARACVRAGPQGWIFAIAWSPEPLRGLAFSYGVHPVLIDCEPDNWRHYIRSFLEERELSYRQVLLVEGPNPDHPQTSHRLELFDFGLPSAD